MNIDKVKEILNDENKIREYVSDFMGSFEEKTFVLEIPGEPENYVRERVVRGNHAYNPKKKKMQEFNKIVWNTLSKDDQEYLTNLLNPDNHFNYEVSLSFMFYIPTQKGSSIKDAVKKELQMIVPITTPDCDNFIKFDLDALHGIFYDNDSKVTDVYGAKRYSINPRTSISCTIRKFK